MVLILISAVVMMLSAGVKINGSKVSCAFCCLDKYNRNNCNQNSFSQSVPRLFRKQMFIHTWWKSGRITSHFENQQDKEAELIEAGKEIQSNKISILIQMFYVLADVEVDINSAYSVHASQKLI